VTMPTGPGFIPSTVCPPQFFFVQPDIACYSWFDSEQLDKKAAVGSCGNSDLVYRKGFLDFPL